MSKQTSNWLMTFIKGYWEFPTTQPNYWYSFTRGVVLSLIVSIISPYGDVAVMLFATALVGLTFVAIDSFAWKYLISKKKGE